MSRYLFAFLFMPVLGLAQVSDYVINTIIGTSTATILGDGGPAIEAALSNPIGLWLDASHNLYIADSGFNRVRQVAATNGAITNTSIIKTLAGNGTASYAGDGAAATSANLYAPFKAVYDSAGNMYIADVQNQVVRMVSKSSGFISTFAGNNGYGFGGDGGPATSAVLNHPVGIAFDPYGNLYIADNGNNRIRVLLTNGTITTVAGNGKAGYSGDMIPATTAELNSPFDVAFDPYGNLYIADTNNYRIRKVNTNGIILTIGGGTGDGYSGDGFVGTNAKLNSPSGLVVDNSGNVYIADSGNNVIRELTPYLPFVNSGGVLTASAFGGFQGAAPGSWIEIYGSDLSFSNRSWTTADFTGGGLTAPTTLDGVTVTIGGQPAYIDYISGSQINAQIPYTTPTGQQPLIVKNIAGATLQSTSVTVNAVLPGMFAPPVFNVGGTQYVGAMFADGTWALPPGAVSGYTSRRAKAGDIITLYGVGFGPVTPNIPAGTVVQPGQNNTLPSFQISIGGMPASIMYAGLAPNAVGLYQFNVMVPSAGASDTAAVTFSINGSNGTQNLHIAVQ